MKKVAITLLKLNLSIVYFILKLLPTKENKVTIISRQQSDPSIDLTYLEHELKNRGYNVVVMCKLLNKNLKSLVTYYFNLYKQMYNLATSKICIVDTYIIPVSVLKHKKDLLIIYICHGVGNIKKFGYQTLSKESGKDEVVSTLMNMHKNYDYVISTSEATNPFYAEAFNIDINKVIPLGNPKIDYILKVKSKKEEILKKYPNLKDKPVILYVSTFRTYEDDYLEKFLDNADTKNYNIIMHIHPVAYTYHKDIDKKLNKDGIYRCSDIATVDLLSVADYVITDYSSFVFESAILKIPTYLYVSDYDKYIEKNGLNVDIFKELPGCVYKESKEIFKAIDNKQYNMDVLNRIKEKYVANCDGKVTQRLVDFIINESKVKEGSFDYNNYRSLTTNNERLLNTIGQNKILIEKYSSKSALNNSQNKTAGINENAKQINVIKKW